MEYFDPWLAGDPETESDYAQVNGPWTRFLYDPGDTQRWSSATIDYTAANVTIDETLNLRMATRRSRPTTSRMTTRCRTT